MTRGATTYGAFSGRAAPAVFLLAVLLAVGPWVSPGLFGAEENASVEKEDRGDPIHITSDKVTSNQNEKWVEFIGNVKATQSDTVITAHSMKILYKPEGKASQGTNTSRIEKMIAQGGVKIVFDKASKTAVAETAVYTASDKKLVLSGGEPMVLSGQDVVRGSKITLFQAENRTLVEGDKKSQVEATFHSQGQGGLIK